MRRVHILKSKINDQDIWDAKYNAIKLDVLDHNHPIKEWIRSYIPKAKAGEAAFEPGVFPGNFIEVFGELGYELNGVDRYPKVAERLTPWFEGMGYHVGQFKVADFLDYQGEKEFQVVASFGFIEHFDNFEEILAKQLELVSDNGYIVLEYPNFKAPVQFLLHSLFDRENLGRHNLRAMNLNKCRDIIESNGFEIITAGPLGGFSFWTEDQKRGKISASILVTVNQWAEQLRKRITKNNSLYSPLSGIIAKKKK